jgi:DnaK suppressor protein
MNATKMKELRRALEDRRGEIQGEVDRMAVEIQDLGIDQGLERGSLGNHLAEDGSNVMEVERLGTISGDLQEILVQVNSALGRMDDGTYGTCQRCGKPINEERLEAFPYVAFCIDCQQILERENALRSGY